MFASRTATGRNPTAENQAEDLQRHRAWPGRTSQEKRAWNRSMWAMERCAVCPSQSTVHSSSLYRLLCFRAVHLLTAPRTQGRPPSRAPPTPRWQCHCQHRSARTCRSGRVGDPGSSSCRAVRRHQMARGGPLAPAPCPAVHRQLDGPDSRRGLVCVCVCIYTHTHTRSTACYASCRW